MKKEKMWKKGMAAGCALGFAALLALAGFSRALKGQEGSSPADEINLEATKHALLTTHFAVNASPVTAGCNTFRCAATSPIFTPSVICPEAVGGSCTYQIHMDAQVTVTSSDFGLFQVLVDGVAPSPGPTTGGLIQFCNYSGSGNTEARSLGVTATETNTTANQAHTLSVSIGCQGSGAGGCLAQSLEANLQIGVYHP